MSTVFETKLTSLPLLHRGKVRENFSVGDDKMLIVASDRLSAFDVILDQPIPEKAWCSLKWPSSGSTSWPMWCPTT